MPRLLICAGGTGGGVYPALSIHQALRSRVDAVLWVGGEGGMEAELVQRAGVNYRSIPAAGVHGVGLGKLPGNLVRLARGYRASRRILAEFKPDALLFTGGYVAVPMALAARRHKSVAFVPDIEPGLALKAISRLSSALALTTPSSSDYFPARLRKTVTGYPLREELLVWTREKGLAHLNLSPELPVLLVTGGSRGARTLNQALLDNLAQLLEFTQVVWISGNLDWERVKSAIQDQPAYQTERLKAMPYLHEMGAALSAADLVVSRAGASTLGEYPYFGLPALLVPYPYAWRYQKTNASWLESHGAAAIIRDEDLPARLLPAVRELLDAPNRQKLAQLRQAMTALSNPHAAGAIADLVMELAAGGQP